MPKRAPDRVGERVVDADERVREREPGEGGGVAHRRAGREVVAVGVGARQGVEDQVQRLHAEGVGVGRGEDRHAGLERVGERVDAGVGGHVRRHRQRQPRLDDRDVRHERVVDERELAAARGQHRRRGDLRAGACRRRHGGEPDRVVDLRVVGHALAGVEERQRQLGERQLRALVEQPHRLRGVEHGASADGDDQVGPQLLQHVDAGADLLLRGLGLDLREHADRAGEVTAHLVGHAAGLGVGVGDQERLGGAQAAQLLERAGVEVGVRRDAEPLRRRLPARHGLDVEQVAVVDVLGGDRAAPGAAAEREGRRHRVVDAAEGADRRRRVDEDAAGADGRGERVDHGLVGRVDRGGVPHPAVLEHDLRGAHGVLDGRRADEAEHRHELLVHERVGRERVEVGRQRREQDLVVGARGEAGEAAEGRARLAERAQLGMSVVVEGDRRQRGRLLLGEQPRAHPLELGQRRVPDGVVDDAGLLGGADQRRVEGLRDQHVDDGHRHVGAASGCRPARCRRRRSGTACRPRWPRRPPSGRRSSR